MSRLSNNVAASTGAGAGIGRPAGPVRWGVIGAGGIADRRMIPEGILPASNARLGALMDTNAALREPLEKKYGVPLFATVGELLSQPVDAVYIATPTHLHEEQAVAAAHAGKHVLCEKPLALDLATGERIVKACRSAGVKLGVGYMMRGHAAHRRIKALLDEGAFGTPVMARAQMTCWFPPTQGNWRQRRSLGGGGSLADMATHGIDLLEFLLGRVTEVTAMTGNVVQRYADPRVEDSVVLLLRFAGGAMGVVDAHFNVPDSTGEFMLELYGCSGAAKTRFTVCQNSGGELRVCLRGGTRAYDARQAADTEGYRDEPFYLGSNIYRTQVEGFSRAVLENAEPPVGAAEGLWSLRVMEAAYRSAETGCRERLSESPIMADLISLELAKPPA